LNPGQILGSGNLPADLAGFRVKLDSVIHGNGGTLARLPRGATLRGLSRQNPMRLLFLPSFSI
jgi:hypothetical protein